MSFIYLLIKVNRVPGSQENPLLEKPPYATTNLVLKLQFRLLSLQIPLFLAHFHKIFIFEHKKQQLLGSF